MRRFARTASGVSTRFRQVEDGIRKLGEVGKWLCCVLLIGLGLGLSPAAAAQTTVTYIHTDALGSVVAESDASGNVIKRYDYEPYGAVVGGQVTDGPAFTGHVSDSATGLSYMQQRYYDPLLGSFLSRDPVTAYSSGDMRFFNAYAYAFNNPYRFNDPDGRCPMPGSSLCGKTIETIQAQDAAQFRSETPLAGKILEVLLDFTPIAGDIKGGLEAVDNPTPGNVIGAVVGLVPVGGDLAKGAIKNSGRVGDFTRAQKNAAKAENAAQNGGQMACTHCGKELNNVASQKGVPTPGNQAQVHHDPAIKDGGGQHSKPVVVCPECHKDLHK